MPELLFKKQGQLIFRVPLSQSLKIGRALDNDITLPEKTISRYHLEVRPIKDKYAAFLLADKQSPVNLSDGHVLTIEPWQIIFQEKNQAPTQKDTVATAQTKILARLTDPLEGAPILKITAPNKKIFTVPVRKALVLGSSSDCDVVLSDGYVSSRHCRIFKDKDQYFLEDLGSTNGTLVFGARIQSTCLKPQMVFELGATKITFEVNTPDFFGLIGKSGALQTLVDGIKRVAPTDHTVLIQGPSGSGKEIVSHAIHQLSGKGPYVVLNCGAISPNLIESELFGHEKGAFTGADNRRIGAFEEANGGTLFLDEIGEMPLDLQPKLLRALENRKIRRVGNNTEIPISVRVIAATHRDLPQLVGQGSFREDLYYRLNVLPLRIPSLKERKEDIPELAHHFLNQSSPGSKTLGIDALQKLQNYDWPGNVRELKNCLFRAIIFSDGMEIPAEKLELKIAEEASQTLTFLEKQKIREILTQTSGNKTKAAELLGIAKSTLFKKIKEYEIS